MARSSCRGRTGRSANRRSSSTTTSSGRRRGPKAGQQPVAHGAFTVWPCRPVGNPFCKAGKSYVSIPCGLRNAINACIIEESWRRLALLSAASASPKRARSCAAHLERSFRQLCVRSWITRDLRQQLTAKLMAGALGVACASRWMVSYLPPMICGADALVRLRWGAFHDRVGRSLASLPSFERQNSHVTSKPTCGGMQASVLQRLACAAERLAVAGAAAAGARQSCRPFSSLPAKVGWPELDGAPEVGDLPFGAKACRGSGLCRQYQPV